MWPETSVRGFLICVLLCPRVPANFTTLLPTPACPYTQPPPPPTPFSPPSPYTAPFLFLTFLLVGRKVERDKALCN